MAGYHAGLFEALARAVETASGPAGLVLIWIYSFLIAFILPLPSEIVLLAPLNLGLSRGGRLAVIMVVSGLGKAAGSVVAFHIGQEVKSSGRVIRFFERRGYDVRAWSRRQTVELARRYGYGGLAIALSVPFFPDTFSIYAFAILERDYLKFALATFAGSVGRLVVTVFVVGGTLSLL
ncbi:MAG: VTT domain-containing protein [Halobacteriales archaeon]|nr:VTT domain-containing protein [Halobacteriales archaeon]